MLSLARRVSPLFCQSYRALSAASAGKVLVLGEAAGAELSGGTLSAITAAKKIGAVEVLLCGTKGSQAASHASSIEGVEKVIVAKDEYLSHGIAEDISPVILKRHNEAQYSHIFANASTFGKDVLPRLSASLDVSPLTDVSGIIDHETFVRPIYAGNAIATVRSSDSVKIATVRSTAFEKSSSGSSNVEVEEISAEGPNGKVSFIGEELSKSERPELSSASSVVSGGRALGSSENFEIIYKLADTLGAAVGASRAAVDAGYVPNDMQVGQTGKVVAPELYIAVGISGAIQHLAGMKDSKTIVAINKDPEAPIFQVADYGLVEDLFKAVPELTEKIQASKSS